MAKKTKVKNGKFYLIEESEKELTLEQINGILDQTENDLLKAQNKHAEALALKAEYVKNMPPEPKPIP